MYLRIYINIVHKWFSLNHKKRKISCKNETKNLDILKKKKTFNFDGIEKNIYLSTTFKNKDVCVS